MLKKEQAIQALADRLKHFDAPLSLPEDWIILCDDDDLRNMSSAAAKALLARAKKETARRWLCARFDPTDMDLELFEKSECSDDTQVFDDKLLKQRALNSIDDVVSTVTALRNTYASLASDLTQPLARQATVEARVAYGYPEERPDRTDCFDEDVRRQCRRIINEIYSKVKFSGTVVYLISTDNPEFVKIGFTTCLERRLKSLRTASHVEPTIHLTIEGTRSLERELHTRFEAARYSREWFRLTDDIKTFIASAGSSEARAGDASTLKRSMVSRSRHLLLSN